MNFLGITDHSKSSFQANGLSEDRLLKQMELIRLIRKDYGNSFRLYCGIECDISIDGRLDYTDTVLEQLDYIIISIHSGFTRSKSEMTKRVIKAIEHPASRIFAHPSGRLLLKREAYEIDLDMVIDAAPKNNVAIELNCNPARMDMEWQMWKKAIKKGVVCSLNPDAHRTEHFNFIEQGIDYARKGWLESKDIINCWPQDKLEEFLNIDY